MMQTLATLSANVVRELAIAHITDQHIADLVNAAARADLAAQIEPDWQLAAACGSSDLDPDCWFTEPDNPAHTAAKAICGSCPVRRSCLAHALAVDEPAGIWGGADETERAQLRQALAGGVPVAAVLGPASWKAVA